jgi:hypothetical protein
MGRQTGFHMSPEDAREFLDHLKAQAPVICTGRSSDSAEIKDCHPTDSGEVLCPWNQAILPALEREYIPRDENPCYRVADSLPVIEWMTSRTTDWDGAPALTQGRVYARFDVPNEPFMRWFESIVRGFSRTMRRIPLRGNSAMLRRTRSSGTRRAVCFSLRTPRPLLPNGNSGYRNSI